MSCYGDARDAKSQEKPLPNGKEINPVHTSSETHDLGFKEGNPVFTEKPALPDGNWIESPYKVKEIWENANPISPQIPTYTDNNGNLRNFELVLPERLAELEAIEKNWKDLETALGVMGLEIRRFV